MKRITWPPLELALQVLSWKLSCEPKGTHLDTFHSRLNTLPLAAGLPRVPVDSNRLDMGALNSSLPVGELRRLPALSPCDLTRPQLLAWICGRSYWARKDGWVF